MTTTTTAAAPAATAQPVRTIWHRKLRHQRATRFDLGTNPRVLTVATIGDRVAVWAEHDRPEPTAAQIAAGEQADRPATMWLVPVRTGEPVPQAATYLGTAHDTFDGRPVHVYEVDEVTAAAWDSEVDLAEVEAAANAGNVTVLTPGQPPF
jgi:hypothetical protein